MVKRYKILITLGLKRFMVNDKDKITEELILNKTFPMSTCARVQELITAIQNGCTFCNISAFNLEKKGNIINLGFFSSCLVKRSENSALIIN